MFELILAAFLLFMLWLVADDDKASPFIAFFALLAFGLAVTFVSFGFFAGLMTLITYVLTNPWTVLVAAVGYVAAGLIWSTIKWVALSRSKLKLFNSNKDIWRKEYDGRTGSYSTFASYVSSCYGVPPSVFDNKHRIVTWLMWWPLSMVGTLLNIRKFFTWLYTWVSQFYTKINHMIWKDSGLLDEVK